LRGDESPETGEILAFDGAQTRFMPVADEADLPTALPPARRLADGDRLIMAAE
jgi:hypothetical protein